MFNMFSWLNNSILVIETITLLTDPDVRQIIHAYINLKIILF